MRSWNIWVKILAGIFECIQVRGVKPSRTNSHRLEDSYDLLKVTPEELCNWTVSIISHIFGILTESGTGWHYCTIDYYCVMASWQTPFENNIWLVCLAAWVLEQEQDWVSVGNHLCYYSVIDTEFKAFSWWLRDVHGSFSSANSVEP